MTETDVSLSYQPDYINEFRSALVAEYEAAKRTQSGSSIALLSGRRMARVGRGFRYVFKLELPFQVPDDVPADLRVPGLSPIRATVLAVNGLSVELVIGEDLGAFIPHATLQSGLAELLLRLIDRIEQVAAFPNPAGERVLGRASVGGTPPAVFATRASVGQARAVASCLHRDTTFIWGPPGTGKTTTIGKVGTALRRAGRSLLVVSHTNVAVDQAILKIAEALGSDPEDGSVIRVGDPRLQELSGRPLLLSSTYVERLSTELTVQKQQLMNSRGERATELSSLEDSLDRAEWAEAAGADLVDLRSKIGVAAMLAERGAQLDRRLMERRGEREKAEQAIVRAGEVNTLLESMGGLRERVRQAEARVKSAETSIREVRPERVLAEELLAQAEQAGRLVRMWRKLPAPRDQSRIVDQLRSQEDELLTDRASAEATLKSELEGLATVNVRLTVFHHDFRGLPPSEVIANASTTIREIDRLRSEADVASREAQNQHRKNEKIIRDLWSSLEHSGLVSREFWSQRPAIEALEQVRTAVVDGLRGLDVTSLRSERDRLYAEVRAIENQIEEVEAQLRQVEDIVISRATVVGTTLTRAYLRESIQGRRFDTVLLDEASMAPIPALWAAAALSDRSVVVVGDFRQLPPICLSDEPLAQKWLGRDIFEESGVRAAYERGEPPPWFVPLNVQHRMRPEISAIVNALVYDGHLVDATDAGIDQAISSWLETPPSEHPVLLLDMGSANAWVTSGGKDGSRLNLLSGALSVAIAQALLSRDRPEFQEGDAPRILMISPYRPHARYIGRLLQDMSLDLEVVAGTAHSFQGSEAPVVIVDLVNDEPHWKVGMFQSAHDDTTMRLLNVAVTRAKSRILILGDFKYASKLSKSSAFMHRFIAYLKEKASDHEAADVALEWAASRFNGDDRAIVNEERFQDLLAIDIRNAQHQVVLYSPTIDLDRLRALEDGLVGAVHRGVSIYVITKPSFERGRREAQSYESAERMLSGWGVHIIHKPNMLERIAIIDSGRNGIVWLCSLPVLSRGASGIHDAGGQGHQLRLCSLPALSRGASEQFALRRASGVLSGELTKVLQLDPVLKACDAGELHCPICNQELMPAEGTAGLYWRCADKDCHTRSLDQPAPRDGRIVCTNCGGKVEFGCWGNEPAWRCQENRRHHQKVARSHLRLPKMLPLIPPAKRNHFGL